MQQYQLLQQTIQPLDVFLGFIIIAVIFGVLLYWLKPTYHNNMKRCSNIAVQSHKRTLKFKFNPNSSSENQQTQMQIQIPSKQQNKIPLHLHLQAQTKSKIRNPSQTWTRLSNFAYNYTAAQHDILNIYRSQTDIQKERQSYINRKKKVEQIKPGQNIDKKYIMKQKSIQNWPKPTQSQDEYPDPKQDPNKINQKIQNPTEIQTQIQNNNTQTVQPSAPKTILFPTSLNNNKQSIFSTPIIKDTPKNQQNKQIPKNQNIIPNHITTKKESIQMKDQNIEEKKQIQREDKKFNAIVFKEEENKLSKQLKKQEKKQQKKQQQMPQKKEQEKPKLVVQPAEQRLPQLGQVSISTSQEYLQSIIKYSSTFGIKTQISTIISNLNGAKSDPKQLWVFASSYIRTINTNNSQQVATFAYRVWEAIVHKFIKNTNIKDGFERIPPKEKNRQVEKNSINTYVVLLNIFKTMGHEAIWLGIFGKTLKMLQFLYKRKDPIKNWKKLQLIQMNYVSLDSDVSAKYHSRLDFLTYFLLALTTFDPIQVFEQVSQKTGQVYNFLNQLKKYKHKWSYNQFWCLVDLMRKNKQQFYFKIPFWNNVLTVIYPQMLKNLKEGSMKQFTVLSKWIFKQVKQLTKNIDKSAQAKELSDQQQEDPSGKYEFDGEQFIGGIKTLGRGIDTRQREMKVTKWEEFRDKCSIFYYFWRKDSI